MSRDRDLSVVEVRLIQLLMVGTFLLAWIYLPHWEAARERFPVLDPYFISSPELVTEELGRMLTGADGSPRISDYVLASAKGVGLGTVFGMVSGMLAGMMFSQFRPLDQLFSPYMNALNATPRLVLVPIVIIFFGPSTSASVAVTTLVVFLTVFFSAFAGGKSVPEDLVLNAALLGASPWRRMMRVRWKYVSVWTLSVLPNTLATAYVAGILTELLSTSNGLGRLVRLSLQRADATLTYALVVVMCVLGALLVWLGRIVTRRALHWWAGVHAI